MNWRPRSRSGAEWVFRVLLRAYPPAIRKAYGKDLLDTFRDAYRGRGRGISGCAAFWLRTAWEALRTIPPEWLEAALGRNAPRNGPGRRGPHSPHGRRRTPWWEAPLVEVRLALRNQLRTPGEAAPLVVTLAVGIAGVTAIASLVWGVLLAPLPYPGADRLVRIWHNAQVQSPNFPRHFGVSPDQIRTFREETRTLEELTHIWTRGEQQTLMTDGVAEDVEVAFTAGNFMSFLGASVVIGRRYEVDDEVGDEQVVVLSHAAWVRRYGGDRELVGTHMSLGGSSYRVIGVLGPDSCASAPPANSSALLSLMTKPPSRSHHG